MLAVSIKNLSFSYPDADFAAVDDVSFDLEAGSYTVLAGLNGSGKSTLARIIAGLIENSSGFIHVQKGFKVGIVLQAPKEQIICGTVSREVGLGPKNQGFSKGEVELKTIYALETVNMLPLAQCGTFELSLGQSQKIVLASIIAMEPDILILDESLAMVDPESREEIFRILEKFIKNGKTILHITHDLEAVRRSKDVIVMNFGKIIWQGSSSNFFLSEKIFSTVSGPVLEKNNCLLQNVDSRNKTFSFKDIKFSYGDKKVLENINIDFYKGTLNCITGASGSGKSTLLELAAGLLIPDCGKIYSSSRPSLVQQNSDAALFENFAGDDVAFGPINLGFEGEELYKIVKESMEKVGLPFEKFADRQTFYLSGGEKRRLSIAGIIALNSDIIFFDEPTAALDGLGRYKIIHLMKQLAMDGKTVIFTTHTPEEADFSDRRIHIKDGKIVSDTLTLLSLCDKKSSDVMENICSEDILLSEIKPFENAKILKNFSLYSSGLTNSNFKTKTPLKKVPAVIKCIIFLTMFVPSLSLNSLIACTIMLCLSICYTFLSGNKIIKTILSMLKIIPLLLFFCIFQMIFAPTVPGEHIFIAYKFFQVSPSKLILCLKTLLHCECVLLCIRAFINSINENELAEGFEGLLMPLKVIKIPVKYFVVLMEITFRFIPLLVDEASCIIKTQLIRGALGKSKGFFAKIKAIIPLIVPLMIQTIKRAQAMAEAMTARGF